MPLSAFLSFGWAALLLVTTQAQHTSQIWSPAGPLCKATDFSLLPCVKRTGQSKRSHEVKRNRTLWLSEDGLTRFSWVSPDLSWNAEVQAHPAVDFSTP